MRPILLLISCFACFINSFGQKASTVAISTTGCTVEVFCFPGRFDAYELEEGSTVFADDCEYDDVNYGIYCVQLKNPISDLNNAEDTVISYLDFLKLDYGIVKSKGYDKGHKLNKDKNTRGVYDSWEDLEKNKWKIRAWTDGKFICILHMHSKKELPDKKADVFLNGIRFPGMK